MKSLILKDIYNVSQNMKSMVLVLAVLALAMIPTTGPQGYLFSVTLLFTMMTVTTFSVDEASKWNPYALVMPISREKLVAAKFAVMLLFSAAGALLSLTVGAVGAVIAGTMALEWGAVGELALYALGTWGITVFIGATLIPLIFRFGPEQGRLLMFVAVLIPMGILLGAYYLLTFFGITVTDTAMLVFFCASPLVVLAWSWFMYRISCRIFAQKEL